MLDTSSSGCGGRHSWPGWLAGWLALVELVRLIGIDRRQRSLLHKRPDKIVESLDASLELHLDYFILALLVAISILGVSGRMCM